MLPRMSGKRNSKTPGDFPATVLFESNLETGGSEDAHHWAIPRGTGWSVEEKGSHVWYRKDIKGSIIGNSGKKAEAI